MNDALRARLSWLCDLVEREIHHLLATDSRLFHHPFTPDRVAALAADDAEAERVDAFVARFGRLQDTVGDKLLPHLLRWLGHTPGPMIDNLRLLEKWGWLEDTEVWLDTRLLRNRLIHEYQTDPIMFADALDTAHARVRLLVATARLLIQEFRKRDTPG